MPGLRFAYLLALVVWLGGLLVLAGVAAPTITDVLQARTPADGRLLAGIVFDTVLSRFHLVSFGCAATMVVALVAMALLGPRPRPFAPRLATIGVMLGATAMIVVPLGWPIGGAAGAATGTTGLMTLTAVGGILLVFWDARERRS